MERKSRYIDLTGKTFGRLTVIGLNRIEKEHDYKIYWNCKCICGNYEIIVRRGDGLKYGTPSCGCFNKERMTILGKQTPDSNSKKQRQAMVGKICGILKVISFNSVDERGNLTWNCQCECGNTTIVSTKDLKSGHVKSCGCISSYKEMEIEKFLKENEISFKKEYSFPDLLSDKMARLRYDFVLFNNKKLVGIIEYHGKQHYNSDSAWSSEEYRRRDKQKELYCLNNHIPLLILN